LPANWIAQWVLGLTDKAFQNVLRDNPDALIEYRDRYIETCRQVISSQAREYIERLAQAVDGTIIQMSAGYWPQQVARELNRVVGFKHELVNMKPARIEKFLERGLRHAPLEEFIGLHDE
jgi:hypothetical protein